MALAVCNCKYNWPVIGSQCIACGQIVLNYDATRLINKERDLLPKPPVTMDQIADTVKFIIDGPDGVWIMAKEIAEKATNDDSDLPDPLV